MRVNEGCPRCKGSMRNTRCLRCGHNLTDEELVRRCAQTIDPGLIADRLRRFRAKQAEVARMMEGSTVDGRRLESLALAQAGYRYHLNKRKAGE